MTAHRSRRLRLSIGLLAVSSALLVVCALSIAYGTKPIPMAHVWSFFTAYDGRSPDHSIIRTLRIPRTVVGLLAGACLGLAGGVMQGFTRNPLADPGILGVNAGAALFVVIAIDVMHVTEISSYLWFAFAGALVASTVVYVLGSSGRTGATPVKIALAGAAMTALVGSFTSAILVLDTATLDQFRFWVVGSLSGRTSTIAADAAPFAVVALIVALAAGGPLNSLALGDETARGLGVNINRARFMCMVAIVLTAGTATALAGPVGFVGLAIPHLVRHFTGPDHRWLLPYCMLTGPILLLGSDTLGRVIDRPAEVQVGIVTSLVGAPVFIRLVRRTKLASL